MLTGLGLLTLLYFMSRTMGLYTLTWLLQHIFSSLFILIVVIFQADIRQALGEMGAHRLFRRRELKQGGVEEVVMACVEMARLRGGALTVENVSVSPATVVLRGPEDVVSDISSVPLTIMLDPKAAGTTVHQTITLDTPSLVTANPPSVRVQYTITSGRTVVSRRCKVELAGENRRQYTVEPEEVTVLVEVPEALAKSARYLGQLEVSVTPPALEPEQSKKVELRFRLPEGMTLLNPATEEVTVSRKKK